MNFFTPKRKRDKIPAKDPQVEGHELSELSPTASHAGANLHGGRMWTPVVLRAATLSVFGMLFAVILIVVEVLWHFSNKKHGLTRSDSNLYYLWTYGPTAVFLIIAGCWTLVEYRTKQMMPWKALQTPQPAQKSLLLDYVSDWNVVSLFLSLKNRHWVVALAILGSLLIKLVTVVSTGLLMLQNVRVTDIPVGLSAQAQFSGDGYNSELVDASAALSVVGTRWLDLPRPAGTTDEYAFAPFTGSNIPPGSDTTISGTVDLFSADLSCEVATVGNWTQDCQSRGCEAYRLNLTLSTPSCPEYRFTSFLRSPSRVGGYYFDVFSESCKNNDDLPLIFVNAHWVDNRTRIQSIVCEPTYKISKGDVTLRSSNQSVVSIKSDHSSGQIAGVDGYSVGASLLPALDAAKYAISTLIGYGHPEDPNSIWKSTFSTIANMSTPHSPDDLFDSAILERVSRDTYKALMAQVARQYLMANADRPFQGTYSEIAPRLVIRDLSVRVMEPSLAILLLVCIALWVWGPRNSTPRDPATIAGLASILARSPGVSDRLTGTTNKKDMKASLADGVYRSETRDGEFRIASEKSSEDCRPTSSGAITWWRPFSLSLWWRILAVVIPLAIIAALEATYQVSRRQSGLATISSDGYIRYTWVYIPAFIMLLVQTLFDGIHFSTRVLQPYLELRRGSTARSLMENHLSKLTVHSFWSALMRKQHPVSLTALVMLLAPCLTVAVSGLYSAETFSVPRHVSIVRSDSFNKTVDPDPYGKVTSNGLGLTGALVVSSNLSYPAWTYGEFVLPALNETSLFDMQQDKAYLPSNKTSTDPNMFSLILPALRAALSCDKITKDMIVASMAPGTLSSTYWVNVHLGEDCDPTADSKKNQTWTAISVPINGTDITNIPFGAFETNQFYQSKPECPAMFGVFGSLTTNSTDGISGFTCYPRVDLMDVNATFALPGMQLQSVTPTDSPSTVFARNFSSQLSFKDFLTTPPLSNTSAFDGFFTAMLNDQQSLSTADITNLDDTDKVLNATQQLYRTLMAQNMNGNLRLPPSDPAQFYNGTILDTTRVRLVQSAISTRILEGVLVAMVLCTIVAYWVMGDREVVPVNPCTLAGAMVPLAGSDVLAEVPKGAEWWGDRELGKRGVFGGLVFSLGWWGGKGVGDGEVDRSGLSNDIESEGEGYEKGRFGIGIGKGGV